jgi:DNA-binding MarR family transcriptional regulator
MTMGKNLELTTTDKQCLIAYQKHVGRYGAPPTRRQLADYLGVYPNTITRALKRLEDKGAIVRITPHVPRTVTAIRLTAKAKKAVAG